MKRIFMPAVAACLVLFLTSCEKIQEALFKPFESPLNFEITIPVINTTTAETSMGQTVVHYNLDSVIRKNTDDKFGADFIGSMYLNEVAIQLLNDDGSNNLGNFDYVKLSVFSGGTPAVLGPFNVPANASSSASFAVPNSPNIKPFFSGANVSFELKGKANQVTTKTLRARISATIKFDK